MRRPCLITTLVALVLGDAGHPADPGNRQTVLRRRESLQCHALLLVQLQQQSQAQATDLLNDELSSPQCDPGGEIRTQDARTGGAIGLAQPSGMRLNTRRQGRSLSEL